MPLACHPRPAHVCALPQVFITLSFYVMCKSTTPIFLLIFAIAWGIEKPSWGLAGVVTVITGGLLLLVAGETQFDLVGFILVMTAAMLAGLRWTITQVLLQGKPGERGERCEGVGWRGSGTLSSVCGCGCGKQGWGRGGVHGGGGGATPSARLPSERALPPPLHPGIAPPPSRQRPPWRHKRGGGAVPVDPGHGHHPAAHLAGARAAVGHAPRLSLL